MERVFDSKLAKFVLYIHLGGFIRWIGQLFIQPHIVLACKPLDRPPLHVNRWIVRVNMHLGGWKTAKLTILEEKMMRYGVSEIGIFIIRPLSKVPESFSR